MSVQISRRFWGVFLMVAIAVPHGLGWQAFQQPLPSGIQGEFLWESMLIQRGQIPYSASPTDHVGVGTSLYPPVFPALLALFVNGSPSDLPRARLIATLPLIVSVVLIYGYLRRRWPDLDQKWLMLTPAVYVLTVAAYAPVWSIRPNHLWLCLGIAALCSVDAFVRGQKWRWLSTAILLSVLCCYTKQQGIAFAGAIASYLLLSAVSTTEAAPKSLYWRGAGVYVVSVALIGLGVLGILNRLSDGGFSFWMVEIPRLSEYRPRQLIIFIVFLIPLLPFVMLHAWWIGVRRWPIDVFQLSLFFAVPLAVLPFIKEGGAINSLDILASGLIVPIGPLWIAFVRSVESHRRVNGTRALLAAFLISLPGIALWRAFALSTDGALNPYSWLLVSFVTVTAAAVVACLLGLVTVSQAGPTVMATVVLGFVMSIAIGSRESEDNTPILIAFEKQLRSNSARCCMSRVVSCSGYDLYVMGREPRLPSMNNLTEYWIARETIARETIDISTFVNSRCASILFGRRQDLVDATYFVPNLADPNQWSTTPLNDGLYLADQAGGFRVQ